MAARRRTDNPFPIGKPSDKQFCDRHEQLHKLSNALATPSTRIVLLEGTRRIGKSSLLERFKRECRKRAFTAGIDARNLVDLTLKRMARREITAPLLTKLGQLLAHRIGLDRADPIPTETRVFREEFLAQAMDAAGERRLVVLVDELEAIEDRNSESVQDLIDAFDVADVERPPLLILVWGRPFGMLPSPGLASSMRASFSIDVGPFKREVTNSVPRDLAGEHLDYDPVALEFIWQLTRGHPFFLMALHHELFASRDTTLIPAKVTGDRVLEAVQPAFKSIRQGLFHAWRQLSQTQSLLVQATAKLTHRPLASGETSDEPRIDFVTSTSLGTLQREINKNRDITLEQLRSAADGLVSNKILLRQGRSYRLYAPFLGYWLTSTPPDELLAGEGIDAERLYRTAEKHSKDGDNDRALEVVMSALEHDRQHLESNILAAELWARKGALDAAIDHIEVADRIESRTARPRLLELLTQRLKQAVSAQEDPREWYERIRALDPSTSDSEYVAELLTRYYIGAWKTRLATGDFEAAAESLRILDALSPRGWRSFAVEPYKDFLAGFKASPEQLLQCLAAIRDAFLIMTRKPIARASPDAAKQAILADLEEQFRGEPELQAKIQARYSVPEYWHVTARVLARALQYPPVGHPLPLPVKALKVLLYRAPTTMRERISADIARALPTRWPILLRSSLTETTGLLRVLSDFSGSTSSEALWTALATYLLELADSDDDEEAIRFFEHGADIYAALIEAAELSNAEIRSADVLTHVEILLDRLLQEAQPQQDETEPQNQTELQNQTKPHNEMKQWALIRRGWSGLARWIELLKRPALAEHGQSEALRERLTPPPAVERSVLEERLGPEEAWLQDVHTLLKSGKFEELDKLDAGIFGVPRGKVVTYRARLGRERVQVKVYKLPGKGQLERRFLRGLWANERRVLVDVGTRHRGRALTQLKFTREYGAATGDSHDSDKLILVTEDVGQTRLRDVLERGRTGLLAPDRQGARWREIYALVEALAALHKAYIMHRAIRPENVMVVQRDNQTRLKLVNYEWSSYLRTLATQRPADQPYFDRYHAPEVLAERFQIPDRPAGTNFGSDVYSLGLVLFEMLVRRLTANELGRYVARGSYDYQAHCDWLDTIRQEIRTVLQTQPEKTLLLDMLKTDIRERETDLTGAIETTRRLAMGTSSIQEELNRHTPRLSTTLYPKTRESIAQFLRPWLDEDRDFDSKDELRTFVERELSEARVYRNGGEPRRPLVLVGHRFTFAARPFTYNHAKYRKIPFVTVATLEDRKTGPMIARLPKKVRLLDLDEVKQNLRENLLVGDVWRSMFELASHDDGQLGPEQRELHTLLAITAEVEHELWKNSIVSYKLVRQWTDGNHDFVLITGHRTDRAIDGGNLSSFVAGQMSHQINEFELGTTESPVAPFDDERVWTVQRVWTNKEWVLLRRRTADEAVPHTGFLRSKALAGNRSVFHRRRNVLRALENDAYLLTAVSEPDKLQSVDAHDDIPLTMELDEDKRRIVKSVLTRRPLFVVKGPPGTGKTTLAAEIVLRELERNPSSRILVTSQAHEPLNNLLLRVDQLIEDREKASRRNLTSRDARRARAKQWEQLKPMAIRLAAVEKLTQIEEGEAHKIAEYFHPARIAARRVALARQWRPNSRSQVSELIAEEWREFWESRGSLLTLALQDRMVRSANLVYATANSRDVATLPDEQSFDLLIYEEAAKAYPLEVLGPMRLARKWLLIGDHDQLPPFNIEAFQKQLGPLVQRAVDSGSSAIPTVRREGLSRLQLSKDSVSKAIEISEFFAWLFDKGQESRSPDRWFSDQLTRQWRMHPTIGALLKHTYFPELKNGDADLLRAKRKHRVLAPKELSTETLVWIDVPLTPLTLDEYTGESEIGHLPPDDAMDRLAQELPAPEGGYRNPYEATVLVQLMKFLKTRGYGGFKGKHIAFLSPYRGQVKMLNQFFRNWDSVRNPQTGDLRNRAMTVDSAQGRQWQAVVVSLVRNNPAEGGRQAYGFLTSRERASVMFSRAESLLVVIGCSDHFAKESMHLHDVYRYIKENGLIVNAREWLTPEDYERLTFHDSQRASKRRAMERDVERELRNLEPKP